jgi:hypothetical protein
MTGAPGPGEQASVPARANETTAWDEEQAPAPDWRRGPYIVLSGRLGACPRSREKGEPRLRSASPPTSSSYRSVSGRTPDRGNATSTPSASSAAHQATHRREGLTQGSLTPPPARPGSGRRGPAARRAMPAAPARCAAPMAAGRRPAPRVRTRARRALDRVGLGIPLPSARPSSARAIAVSNSRSMASAGRTSTKSRAGSRPALAQSCATPGGTTTTSPGPARMRSRRTRNCNPAAHDLEALLLLGVEVKARRHPWELEVDR